MILLILAVFVLAKVQQGRQEKGIILKWNSNRKMNRVRVIGAKERYRVILCLINCCRMLRQ